MSEIKPGQIFSFWRDAKELAVCFADEKGIEFLSGIKGKNFVNISPKFSESEDPKEHAEQLEAIKELHWILMNYYGLQVDNKKLRKAIDHHCQNCTDNCCKCALKDVLKNEGE